MANRFETNVYLKQAAIYHFPVLRHLKNDRAQSQIDKSWRERYPAAIQGAIETSLKPITPPEVKQPGGFLIEITNACNLRCPMCSTHLSEKKKSNMDLETFEKIMQRMQEQGATSCSLHTVGETFLHPQLKELVAIARRYGVRPGISTHANHPDRIRALYEAHGFWINGFRFSIDGATKETYEKLRVRGKFEKMIESCEWIHRTNRGKPQSRVALTIDCVVSDVNIGEMATFFHRFTEYTYAKDIRFSMLNSLAADDTFYKEKRPEFDNLYRLNTGCSFPFGATNFNNKGEVTVCCRDYEDELVIGDAMSQPLSEIWTGDAAEDLRRQHRGEVPLTNRACANCYVPKPGVSRAFNGFLHYLWQAHRDADDREWAVRTVDFMDDLNTLLGKPEAAGTETAEIVARHVH